MNVGILAWHGSVKEHGASLKRLGLTPVYVRQVDQLKSLTHLIIPGGESTVIGQFIVKFGLLETIIARANNDLALWGTCAGAILMSKVIHNAKPLQTQLNVMDVTIRRNAYGRQLDSFETLVDLKYMGETPAIFIRAPMIEKVAPQVEILGCLQDGSIVAAKQNKCLITTFHPELTDDTKIHRYFVEQM